MKSICLLAALLIGGTAANAQAAGCLSGAAVGGVAGHVAGHHGVLGAAAGCAIGHHEANKDKRAQDTASQNAAPADSTGPQADQHAPDAPNR